MKQKVTHDELIARQSLPLDVKIELSKAAIEVWYDWWKGDVRVSFSGGMDSTVLLHLVRSIYPEVQAVCVDALLYPEIREHVKATENVKIIKPRKTFQQVVKECGYPVISKNVAMGCHRYRVTKSDEQRRLRLRGGVNPTSGKKQNATIPPCWHHLVNAPFKISEKCCYWMKKAPLHNEAHPYVGQRTKESRIREMDYLRFGCNAFDKKFPISTPIAFWLDSDIWDYVRAFNVPYSRIYDMGYTRTGCFACMFGVHLEAEPNRFQRMRITHPQLWRACEHWGIPEVLDYIGVSYDAPQQPRLFERAASGKMLLPTNI